MESPRNIFDWNGIIRKHTYNNEYIFDFDWNRITKQHAYKELVLTGMESQTSIHITNTYNKKVSECGGWIHCNTPLIFYSYISFCLHTQKQFLGNTKDSCIDKRRVTMCPYTYLIVPQKSIIKRLLLCLYITTALQKIFLPTHYIPTKLINN